MRRDLRGSCRLRTDHEVVVENRESAIAAKNGSVGRVSRASNSEKPKISPEGEESC